MNEIFADFVGPIAPWLTPLSLGAVVAFRNSIRKSHLIALVLITILSFLAFFSVLLLGLAGAPIPPFLLLWVLRLLGMAVLLCGPAIGFFFILKTLGFVRDETVVVLPRAGLRRIRR